MKIFIILSALISVSLCDIDCNWANGLDCTQYPAATDCGTDGVTYSNRCFFTKAYCKDKTLGIYADTDCAAAGLTTPSPPTTAKVSQATQTTQAPFTGPTTTRAPIFLGHDAVMDFFCRELSKQTCQDDTEQVCASDNQTYPNVCEFEKARCTHRKLTVVDTGAC